MASTVRDLRRTRRIRRLGDLEWFEIAYRVYLTALVGGVVVLWLSDLVDDTAVASGDVAARGPAVLGVVVAFAVAAGLRSGASGGPVAIEAADVRHLLLAPIPRRHVLLRPVAQRLRALGFAAAVAGAVAGQLAASRLPGSPAAWVAGGALFGALVAATFVAVAVIAHALRVPGWVSGAVGATVVVWQAAAAAARFAGPLDAFGGVGVWGMRQRAVEVAAAVVVAAAVALALGSAGRLRIEPLVRRADLVSQLHFAVAVQDLRTVVLLRRQLRGEHARQRPWLRIGSTHRSRPGVAVWQRDWRGLARSPLARLARMVVLAIAAGVAARVALEGTTPAVVGLAVALFVLGLESGESLAQEIDHIERLEGLPRPRGWLLTHHLAAPAVALVPFAAIATVPVILDRPTDWPGAIALAIPMTWVGALGAAVSIVRGAPDPSTGSLTGVPPEFAGFRESLRVLVPLLVSTVAAVPVLIVREEPAAATVARSVVALVLIGALIVWWIRRRDELAVRLQAFLDAGRAR